MPSLLATLARGLLGLSSDDSRGRSRRRDGQEGFIPRMHYRTASANSSRYDHLRRQPWTEEEWIAGSRDPDRLPSFLWYSEDRQHSKIDCAHCVGQPNRTRLRYYGHEGDTVGAISPTSSRLVRPLCIPCGDRLVNRGLVIDLRGPTRSSHRTPPGSSSPTSVAFVLPSRARGRSESRGRENRVRTPTPGHNRRNTPSPSRDDGPTIEISQHGSRHSSVGSRRSSPQHSRSRRYSGSSSSGDGGPRGRNRRPIHEWLWAEFDNPAPAPRRTNSIPLRRYQHNSPTRHYQGPEMNYPSWPQASRPSSRDRFDTRPTGRGGSDPLRRRQADYLSPRDTSEHGRPYSLRTHSDAGRTDYHY